MAEDTDSAQHLKFAKRHERDSSRVSLFAQRHGPAFTLQALTAPSPPPPPRHPPIRLRMPYRIPSPPPFDLEAALRVAREDEQSKNDELLLEQVKASSLIDVKTQSTNNIAQTIIASANEHAVSVLEANFCPFCKKCMTNPGMGCPCQREKGRTNALLSMLSAASK